MAVGKRSDVAQEGGQIRDVVFDGDVRGAFCGILDHGKGVSAVKEIVGEGDTNRFFVLKLAPGAVFIADFHFAESLSDGRLLVYGVPQSRRLQQAGTRDVGIRQTVFKRGTNFAALHLHDGNRVAEGMNVL